MWRSLFIVGLLISVGPYTVPAQPWSGTVALGLSGGARTNLYLDPVLGTWHPDVDSPFLTLTPTLGLTRDAARTRIDLTVRSRLEPFQSDRPQFTQSTIRLHRRLHSNWTLGLLGGGTRFRYPGFAGRARIIRDSWWGLPSLQWTPTDNTMLTLRTGLTQRIEQLSNLTDRQTSALASVRATHWLTERVQGGVRAYYNSGRTSAAERDFGGVGGTLRVTYWPVSSVSIRGKAAVEQPQYETSSGTVRDRIGRVGIEATWSPRSFLTLFGRGRLLSADLETEPNRSDGYVSAGLRLQTHHVFGESTESPQRRVCETTDDGLRLQVPYDGDGQLYVTGDFNNWSLPGVPMTAADDDTWHTTLDLPSGRYAYRLRVVDDNEGRWLDLPSNAETAKDPFGGTNGVCTIP